MLHRQAPIDTHADQTVAVLIVEIADVQCGVDVCH